MSFDFFYCSRMRDESGKLTVLIVTDRGTGMCIALPTKQKGGRSLSCLVTEMFRFLVVTLRLVCVVTQNQLSLLKQFEKHVQRCGLHPMLNLLQQETTGQMRSRGNGGGDLSQFFSVQRHVALARSLIKPESKCRLVNSRIKAMATFLCDNVHQKQN